MEATCQQYTLDFLVSNPVPSTCSLCMYFNINQSNIFKVSHIVMAQTIKIYILKDWPRRTWRRIFYLVNKRRGGEGDFLIINFVCRLILLNFCEGVKEFLRRTRGCCVAEKCQLAIKTGIPWKEGMTKGKVKETH